MSSRSGVRQSASPPSASASARASPPSSNASTRAYGLGQVRAERSEHELLEVEVAGRVHAAVDDVEVRHRQAWGGARDPGEVLPQLPPCEGGLGAPEGEGDTDDGVGAQP